MSDMLAAISRSVGIGGVNNPADVRIIQQLLNFIVVNLGGPDPKLKVDGLCGPKTKGAIQKFQLHHFGLSGADGRIDPGKQTIKKLNSLAQTATPSQFTGFSPEQQGILKADLARAKHMLSTTIDMLALAPFLRNESMPKRTLLHNFGCDLTISDFPIGQAFESTKLFMIQARFGTLRARIEEQVPMVLEPPADFGADAEVHGTKDPTIHFRPKYFTRCEQIRSATLIHERAHTIFNAPGHPGMGGGLAVLVDVAPDDDKRPFFSTKGPSFFDAALQNPFCYEWAALSLQSGYKASDFRFGGRCGTRESD